MILRQLARRSIGLAKDGLLAPLTSVQMPRKTYDSRLKSKVAVEAIRSEKTVAQIASEFGIHPSLVAQWKQKALGSLPDCFATKAEKKRREPRWDQDALMRQIGELKVENDFLRKKYEAFLDGRP